MKGIISLILILAIGILFSCSKDQLVGEPKNSPDGKGGSTARMVIKGDYLYAVDNSSIKVVDVSTPSNPVYVRTIDIGFGIETIYPFKDFLFIGSNEGMYVYGLSDPSNPNQLSEFAHVTSCDPVIANDTFAFVTLRNNGVCNQFEDIKEIDIIDIKDIYNPKIEIVYQTKSYPFGLDMKDTLLFVCHGENGLTIYDMNRMLNHQNNAELSTLVGLNAYDAVVYEDRLFIIGESGFYQYDYSDIHDLKLISSILKTN
mgnify:CR=1 FL=1